MRFAAYGALVGAGLMGALVGSRFERSAAFAQMPAVRTAERSFASGELIALNSDAENGRQQVILIDPQTRVMSVYHIDRSSGEITLKSVRNVQWDLLLEEFNGTSPSPREIRLLLEQR